MPAKLPFEVLRRSFTTREPRYVAFGFNIDANTNSVTAGELLLIALKPMKSRVTGEFDRVMIDHGFVWRGCDGCAVAA